MPDVNLLENGTGVGAEQTAILQSRSCLTLQKRLSSHSLYLSFVCRKAISRTAYPIEVRDIFSTSNSALAPKSEGSRKEILHLGE